VMGTGKAQARWGCLLAAPFALVVLVQPVIAQSQNTYARGQSVSPAYEGYMKNEDDSFTMYFGYMNSNWVEEPDVPIGPDNNIAPGGPDQGQPTHFYPRRTPYLFTIKVPKDFGKKELIWTLTTNGKTERCYASLKPDYALNIQTMSLEVGGDLGNPGEAISEDLPPDLTVEGAKTRTVRVGEPLTLVAIAGDPDNLPPRLDGRPQPGFRVKPKDTFTSLTNKGKIANTNPYTPPGGNAFIASGPGLRMSWIVYRGPGKSVTFDPDQLETWVDPRPWANSPWSPPAFAIPEPPKDGRSVVKATFKQPGTYVLRAVASDGALFTYENITVEVTPSDTRKDSAAKPPSKPY
jgi:hypothetical protein